MLLFFYLDNYIPIDKAMCMVFISCMATEKISESLLSMPIKGKYGINTLVHPSLEYIIYTFKWFKKIEYPIENI